MTDPEPFDWAAAEAQMAGVEWPVVSAVCCSGWQCSTCREVVPWGTRYHTHQGAQT